MRSILTLVCYILLLSAGYAQNTVVDVIVNSDDHNTLETAVIAAGLDDDLSGDGPFTVFAPTDDAFAAVPADALDALLADPTGALAEVLLYHVVNGSVLSTDLSDGLTVPTLNGKDITVTISNDSVFINDALVTMADIETDNGVVHVIDAVLLPPTTVVDVIVESEVHTTLETAVIAAGLDDDLSGDGPFTVFAPTDAAFAAVPADALDALLADPTGALAEVLLYHVIDGSVLSTDLSDGLTVPTLNGKDITVTISNDSVFINDALVTMVDIETDNGVVHVIDAVLLPPRITVVDVIVESEVHTTLETAVIAAELDDDLSGDGPFTVFAPTDAAFAAVPADALNALLADPTGALAEVLLYHVVDGNVLSTDLSDGMNVTTLNGKQVRVTISNDSVFINNVLVTMADIETDNGVVHVIDAVLLPPTTVWDVIVASEDHTTLEAAVIAAGLDPILNGGDTLTVFAPTDAAFAALPAGTVDALLADPTGDLTEILAYHVLGGQALSTDLSDGMTATTLSGKVITVRISNDSVFINNALVTMADIQTDNGVVHVIDAVLLPPTTVWDIIVDSEDHTILETAVLAAGLEVALNSNDTLTVFAPTDAAFAAVDPAFIAGLLDDPQGNLTTVLLYHVVAGKILSTDLSDGQMATTLQGEDITVTISNDSVFINNALVTVVDLEADNGVVHVIDAVLLPSSITSTRSIDYQLVDVQVFPNPASDQFTIDWKGNELSEGVVRMINSQGQLVKSWINTFNNQTFDINGMVPGAYFLEITSGNRKAIKQIVVK